MDAPDIQSQPPAVETTDAASASVKDRKFSWTKQRRVDSLNLEAGRVSSSAGGHASQEINWKLTLNLAFQSIGVIYGDIGTSPLYVFASTFPDGVHNTNNILGVFSLIIYTLILIPLIKYVFIVLMANDNGDGGTFALYSLICRYAKVSFIPNDQPEDREVSNYRLDTPSNQLRRAQKIKQKLESSKTAKIILLVVTILGTSMVIGDGVLTPCMSVLSAVGGIKSLNTDQIVGVSIGILIILFCAQRFGTDKVGIAFAPAISLWFLFISCTGIYNLIKHDIGVLRAFNPKYAIDYFKRNGKEGWISLGGVVMCITGAEAMFADLGHFNIRAVQISFSFLVFPSLIAAYAGQAAYLVKFPENVSNAFYDSVPNPIYWPTFVIAVAAAIIASQAMISGAFAIISQSLSLGCFPRVKVVHTSTKYEGQVYIPEINFLLMIACIIVTWGFKTTEKIGNAYGIAVVAVMVITTSLVTLIMLIIWKTRMWWIALFFIVYISVDIVYLSAVLYKFKDGGYLPLAFSLVLMIIMGIWHYVYKERYIFELNNKVSGDYVRDLAKNPEIKRIPGIGFLYSELVQGIPPIFPHFISNIPSLHSVIVLVSIKSIPISRVVLGDRYLFRQVEPREYRVFRCVARYGYKDQIEEPSEFERRLLENLKEFIRHEHFITENPRESSDQNIVQQHSGVLVNDGNDNTVRSGISRSRSGSGSTVHVVDDSESPVVPVGRVSNSSGSIQSFASATKSNRISIGGRTGGAVVTAEEEELQAAVDKAREQGVFYLIGEAEVVAKKDSSMFRKFVVNHAYSFLRKNSRQGEKMLSIPRTRLLRVGMIYEI